MSFLLRLTSGLSGRKVGADRYISVSFAGSHLGPNSNTGPMQVSINQIDWGTYDENDDFSYPGGTQVALYQDGILMYGCEPE